MGHFCTTLGIWRLHNHHRHHECTWIELYGKGVTTLQNPLVQKLWGLAPHTSKSMQRHSWDVRITARCIEMPCFSLYDCNYDVKMSNVIRCRSYRRKTPLLQNVTSYYKIACVFPFPKGLYNVFLWMENTTLLVV